MNPLKKIRIHGEQFEFRDDTKVPAPEQDGTSGQILRTNGDGTTRWDNAATQEEIGSAVESWLEENVTSGETLIVDDSLTISGAAADAKVTGDNVRDLKSAIANGANITFVQTGDGYIYKDGETYIANYSSGGTGNNQLMVINDLGAAGITPGDLICARLGGNTGIYYGIGFASASITGTAILISAAPLDGTATVQTVNCVVPDNATSMLIYNRATVLDSPTIQVLSGGLTYDVSILSTRLTQVESDLTDLDTDMTDAQADIQELDDIINGERTSMTFTETGEGYIFSTGTGYVTNYTPGSIGNNSMMVINDLSAAGLAVGDKLEIKVGWATGYAYAAGFSTAAITGVSALFSAVEYPSTDSVQTITFVIPEGTVAIAIFNRKNVYATPTITKIGDALNDLFDEVDKANARIDGLKAELEEVKYNDCVNKPFTFAGKTIDFFGDSITYGYMAGGVQATNPYPKVFSTGVGAASYRNLGESGSTLSDQTASGYACIANKIQNTTLSGDFVFIAGGVNDWQLGVTAATVEAAVEDICDYLDSNYNGTVVFITPINEAGRTTINTPTQSLQNVRNVITRIALEHGYNVVQGYKFPFPVKGDDASYISAMFQDLIHPTELGYAMYAQALRSAVC